jgi:hypothetical protein
MPRRKAAAADAAVAPLPSVPADAPHWQVARVAEPYQVFTQTSIRGATVTATADGRGVVIARSVEENALIDRLPVASPQILATPIPDTHPTEPIDDAGDEPGEED